MRLYGSRTQRRGLRAAWPVSSHNDVWGRPIFSVPCSLTGLGRTHGGNGTVSLSNIQHLSSHIGYLHCKTHKGSHVLCLLKAGPGAPAPALPPVLKFVHASKQQLITKHVPHMYQTCNTL